jgi:hypothetical protein
MKRSSHPTLPPFYIIRNRILIACAAENWDEGEKYRRGAEEMYEGQFEMATQNRDTDALEDLEMLRGELDRCKDLLDEVFFEETGIKVSDGYAERDEMLAAMDADEFDTYTPNPELEMEEQNAVTEVEDNDEVAAESMTLPIRETATPTSATAMITGASSVENIAPTTSIS